MMEIRIGVTRCDYSTYHVKSWFDADVHLPFVFPATVG